MLLLAATLAALLWVNVDSHSYSSLWTTRLSIEVGDSGISLDLRGWINSGLMTFFFFVIGLEARREFDLGELRDRRRLALPVLAGLGGAFAAVAIYLAINAGRSSAHGWGVAMSTDTAFALGLLALVGPRFPDRLRAFLLTVAVVDDLVALLVIVLFYSSSIDVTPLLIALAFYAAAVALHRARVRVGLAYFLLGSAPGWGFTRRESSRWSSGSRSACSRTRIRRAARRSSCATERFREFREQPTAGLAAIRGRRAPCGDAAERAAAAALPPVDELRHRAVVRPRERGHRGRRRPARAGRPLADHARHPVRLPLRQAGSGSRVRRGSSPRRAAGGCGRRSAGPRCSAGAPSPASGSPFHC